MDADEVSARAWSEFFTMLILHSRLVLSRVLSVAKPLIPFFIGISMGLTLSVIVKAIINPSCNQQHFLPGEVLPMSERKILQEQTENFLYGKSEAYQVKLIQNTKNEPPASSYKKPPRPRYAATELGIREKLFVGVLTNPETIDTLGVAVNKTLIGNVPKLVFFLNKKSSSLPQGLSVVVFPNEEKRLVPYHMFKYIQDHYLNTYDFYYFITDNTYVRGENLMRLVKHISIIHDVYMGIPADEGSAFHCSLNHGILLSQSVVSKLVQQLDWCLGMLSESNSEDNIAKCVSSTTQLPCNSKVMDFPYDSYYSKAFDFNRDVDIALRNPVFPDVVTVTNMLDDVQMYKLHRYFCLYDLNQTKQLLEQTKEEITHYAQESPGGLESFPWPRGVDPPVAPKTRFDVIRWEYFTESHIYERDDFQNSVELKGVDKLDIQDIIRFTSDRFIKKYEGTLSYLSLLNGYRRFDPVRGMEYIVDLTMRNKSNGSIVVKRGLVLRPLGQAELIPMPYVTESTRVTLILPVMVGEQDDVVPFLDMFVHSCVDAGENIFLQILFIYNDAHPLKNTQTDVFAVAKNMIKFYEGKYKNASRMAWLAVQHNRPNVFYIMDTIAKKFSKETMFFMCTLGMELSTELLNRVRMNTILGWQVFFPIGFWQYKPNLIYDEKPYPTEIEVSSKSGRFDPNDYSHTSFYNGDYMYARRQMLTTDPSSTIVLIELFLRYHNVHVFRAAEPALKHRFMVRQCTPPRYQTDMLGPLGRMYQRCMLSRAECLNSRAQLAMLLFTHQRKVDEEQLGVMHAQQQKAANVEQMKPNMLK